MTDEDLRRLVRAAVARHAGGSSGAAPSSAPVPRSHTSHGLLTVRAGSEVDGPCLIEPAVACTHCGYCRSLGH